MLKIEKGINVDLLQTNTHEYSCNNFSGQSHLAIGVFSEFCQKRSEHIQNTIKHLRWGVLQK